MKITAIIYKIIYKSRANFLSFSKRKKTSISKKNILQCPIINKLKKLLVEVNLRLVNLHLVKLYPNLHLKKHLSLNYEIFIILIDVLFNNLPILGPLSILGRLNDLFNHNFLFNNLPILGRFNDLFNHNFLFNNLPILGRLNDLS